MSNMVTNSGVGEKGRTYSLAGYHSIKNNATAAAVREKLNLLAESCPDEYSEEEKDKFTKTMFAFHSLFTRFLSNQSHNRKLCWNDVNPLSPDKIISYESLALSDNRDTKNILNKLVVLKLNGGLGTTMGCVGPKSAIEVKEGMKFIDLIVRQIEYLNESQGVNVPLILMNSFNTDAETKHIIEKYSGKKIAIRTFGQSKYPRIDSKSLMPIPQSATDDDWCWYPPGHGDLYDSLIQSGLLDDLLNEGKEYMFISNVDNLGATVDLSILNHLATTDCNFIMELTEKTKADVKGGTLMEYRGQIALLEIAQVPDKNIEDFKSLRKFNIFNTNNVWISLKALNEIFQEEDVALDIIANHKVLNSGRKVIQLETAVGAAIKYFPKGCGIKVPRYRFLPVKNTDDLFLITSDLYSVEHGTLKYNPERIFSAPPLIKLGKHFKTVEQFQQRLKIMPHILELDHLIISGDVSFEKDVTLAGTVVIIANEGQSITIPCGSRLSNKVVSGCLNITEH